MPRRKHGAQPKNANAVSHGLFRNFTHIDRRTAEAKAIDRAELSLVSALGSVTPQESAICRQITIGLWRLSILEKLMAAEYETVKEVGVVQESTFKWDELYLRWGREVREGLRAIGLEERRPEVQGLRAYLAEKERQTTGSRN